jgi:hypothetical protein
MSNHLRKRLKKERKRVREQFIKDVESCDDAKYHSFVVQLVSSLEEAENARVLKELAEIFENEGKKI